MKIDCNKEYSVPAQLSFLPSLGMTGFYSLAEPYNRLVSPSAQYVCQGVKSLKSAIAEGQDPLNTIYKANGDTQASFERDLASNVSLVTLSSDAGGLVVFPSSAMLQVPLADGVVYRNTVLTLPIGAVADSEDLTLLQNEIMEMLQHKFGIRSASYLTTVGAAVVLTQTQHEAVQSARQALIDDGESLVAKNLALQSANTSLLQKVQELEAFITSHLSN